MRAVTVAVVFLAAVAVLHAVRLAFQIPVTVDAAEVPMWASVLGVLVPGGIAVWLWRERRAA